MAGPPQHTLRWLQGVRWQCQCGRQPGVRPAVVVPIADPGRTVPVSHPPLPPSSLSPSARAKRELCLLGNAERAVCVNRIRGYQNVHDSYDIVTMSDFFSFEETTKVHGFSIFFVPLGAERRCAIQPSKTRVTEKFPIERRDWSSKRKKLAV